MKYKCYACINKTAWISKDHGYANGYVIIPKCHPFYAKQHDDYIKVTSLDDVVDYNADDTDDIFRILKVIDSKYENSIPVSAIIPIHGGVTYSGHYEALSSYEFLTEIPDYGTEYWMFAFNTMHEGDNSKNWNEERCKSETLKLLSFLENIENVPYILKENEV